MLTVDLGRLGVGPGTRLLDLGCGGGRHAFAARKLGATVVALDADPRELTTVRDLSAVLRSGGEIPDGASGGETVGDALDLPFADRTFDVVVAAEVLEHVWADARAVGELARVVRPGGRVAVSVPASGPERVCWALSRAYHDTPGGHVRIYHRHELEAKLDRVGLAVEGHHRVHALHSPYWWLKCATGLRRDPWIVRRYHDLLVRQIEDHPRWLDQLDAALNPVLGKSLVVYARRLAA